MVPQASETTNRQSRAAERPLTPFDEEVSIHETRNLLVLAAHAVVMRTAWIFKTESVIMPAFLDAVAGAGWLRGCLPVLNRFGQSVPPLIFAERLRNASQKKRPLLLTTLLMAVPFLLLSVVWFLVEQKRQPWLPAVFLLLYALFFAATGVKQMAFGTLQGKLIRPHRRGRLLGLSGLVGAAAAIVCAWFLLARWLAIPDNEAGQPGGFGYTFGFTGVGFVLSALLVLAVAEPRDAALAGRRTDTGNFLRTGWTVFRGDAEFRKVAWAAMLFMCMQLLFPHYQALGRAGSEAVARNVSFHLMLWVVVQNAGVGVFSLVSGAIADRFGYRLTVRLTVFAAGLTPPAALLLSGGAATGGYSLYWITYVLLGLTPVAMRSFTNYTLELAEVDEHPRYIGTLKLCMAAPFLFSPLAGLLIDLAGFTPVFLGVSAIVVAAGLLTFRLPEPRHKPVTDGFA